MIIKKLDSSMKGKSYLSTFERAILNITSAFETEGPPWRKRLSYNSIYNY